MDAHQTRTLIRQTLDRTWLDFHQRMASHPRSTRLGEYVDCQGRQGWRKQSGRRWARLVRGCRVGERSNEEKAQVQGDEETRRGEDGMKVDRPDTTTTTSATPTTPALLDTTTDASSSINTTSAPTTKPEPTFNPSTRHPHLAHAKPPFTQPFDGAYPFWDTPDLPLPPSRLPPRRTRERPIPACPTYDLVVCYDTSQMNPHDPVLIPQPQQVRVYHRPGFLEPFTHTAYLPHPHFGQPIHPHLPPIHPTRTPLLPPKSSDLRTYGSPVRPVRPYRFCYPLTTLTWTPTEAVWQFKPVYEDEWEVDELLDKVRGFFEDGVAWEEEDRDADIDIILIETLRRLSAWTRRHPRRATYLSLDRVEATGILPQRTEGVDDWAFERDLFGFPTALDHQGGRWVGLKEGRGEGWVEDGDDDKERQREVVKVEEVGEDSDVRIVGNKQHKEQEETFAPPDGFIPVDLRLIKFPPPRTMSAEGGGSSTLAVDLDEDEDGDVDMDMDEDMNMDMPSLSGKGSSSKSKIQTHVRGGSVRPGLISSRFGGGVGGRAKSHQVDDTSTEPPARPTRASMRILQQAASKRSSDRDRDGRPRRHRHRRPRRRHAVRYQQTPQTPRVPITKAYIQALRDIFIPPRPKPMRDEVEPEESRFSGMRNQQELICPNGLCRQYGCLLHVDDAVRDVIPFWPIPDVPASAYRLIDMAALEDIELEPCSLTECWFIAHPDDTDEVDMRELDLSHLKTLLNGMTEAEDDWRVCELVDMFAGLPGRDWTCAQIGRQIARLLDERPPTQQQQASGSSSSQAATIVNAPKVKSKDTLPGHTAPTRSKQVRQQINGLNAGNSQGGRKKRTARDNAEGPAPVFTTDPPLVRPNPVPVCVHEGPCTSDVCDCFRNSNHCNRDCPCPPTCRRRFSGCTCRMQDPNDARQSVCGNKCPCYQANRECDPDLCGTCGAREAVESATRPTDHIVVHQLEGRRWTPGACRNVGLRSGEFQPIRVGYSPVHGYGVFAKVDIPKNSLIIEYVGELIDEYESRWRQEITKPLGHNYLFGLNSLMNVDSNNRGNMSRFINHHGRRDNVTARVVAVQGVHRLEFRATQNIKANEELLFNYGEHFGLIASQESEKRGKGKNKRLARSKSDTVPVLAVPIPAASSSQPPTTQLLEDESSEEDFYVLSSEDSDEYRVSRSKKRRTK